MLQTAMKPLLGGHIPGQVSNHGHAADLITTTARERLQASKLECRPKLLPNDQRIRFESSCALDSNTTRFCNDFETDMELDACHKMPPPLPYYNRNVQFVGPSAQARIHTSVCSPSTTTGESGVYSPAAQRRSFTLPRNASMASGRL